MSTRIYEAYRLPVAILGAFVSDYHIWARKNLLAYIGKMTAHADVSQCAQRLCCGSWNKWWKANKSDPAVRRLICRANLVALSMYDTDQNKATFNLDVSLNIWLHEGYAYVIPYHPRGFAKFARFVHDHGGESYAYWNSTDQPNGISYKTWKSRGDMWEKVCLKDWNKGRLALVVFEGKGCDTEHLIGICKVLSRKHFAIVTSILQDAYFRGHKGTK